MGTHNTPQKESDDPFAGWTPARNWLALGQPLYPANKTAPTVNQQDKYHRSGAMVKVFKDPTTEQHLEGRAEVICREIGYAHADPGFGWYLVCFDGESASDSVYRLLKEPE